LRGIGRFEARNEDRKSPRVKTDFFSASNVMTNTGSHRPNILLSIFQKSCFCLDIPLRHEGRIAIVTTREAGCGGREASQRS
jgi:hypothetical protein